MCFVSNRLSAIVINVSYSQISACRSAERAKEAVKRLNHQKAAGSVQYMLLDLSSFDSIDAFAKEFYEKDLPLHILVNNAGILALRTDAYSENGFER